MAPPQEKSSCTNNAGTSQQEGDDDSDQTTETALFLLLEPPRCRLLLEPSRRRRAHRLKGVAHGCGVLVRASPSHLADRTFREEVERLPVGDDGLIAVGANDPGRALENVQHRTALLG